jgi:hypothetical protein
MTMDDGGITEVGTLAGLIAIGSETGGLVRIAHHDTASVTYQVTFAPFQLQKLLARHPEAMAIACDD